MAEPPTVACTNCGKNMTTDDLRRTSCVHCGQVLAHHARAAQQVAVINQMLVDSNGNGIPDAFEGLAANATRNAYGQMGQQMGIGAANGMVVGQALGQFSQVVHGPSPYGPGGPIGQVQVGGGYVPGHHGAYAQGNAMQAMNTAAKTGAAMSMVMLFVFLGFFLIFVVGGAVAFLLMRAG